MKVLKWTGIIAGMLFVYGLVNAYIGWHIVTFWTHTTGWNGGWIWILFWFIAFSYILKWIVQRWLPYRFSRILKLIGSLWMAPMQYLLLLLPAVDLAALILLMGGVSTDIFVRAAGSAVLIVLTLLLIRGTYNAWNPIVRRYQLNIAKPAFVERLRIAVASDLHLGSFVGKRYLQTFVTAVNALRPDVILLVGDIVEEELEPFERNDMGRSLQQLRAKHGVFGVVGNHEYIGGQADDIVERLQSVGIRMLLDEHVQIASSITLVGRKDRMAESQPADGRKTWGELLESVDFSQPVLVMDHQPTELRQAEAAGVDLILSGHTHRGQLAPNHWITRRVFALDWGYKLFGKMHAIVSSGYGTWGPPFRIGSRSELIELDVRFQREQK